jgi:hypothetical protein
MVVTTTTNPETEQNISIDDLSRKIQDTTKELDQLKV